MWNPPSPLKKKQAWSGMSCPDTRIDDLSWLYIKRLYGWSRRVAEPKTSRIAIQEKAAGAKLQHGGECGGAPRQTLFHGTAAAE